MIPSSEQHVHQPPLCLSSFILSFHSSSFSRCFLQCVIAEQGAVGGEDIGDRTQNLSAERNTQPSAERNTQQLDNMPLTQWSYSVHYKGSESQKILSKTFIIFSHPVFPSSSHSLTPPSPSPPHPLILSPPPPSPSLTSSPPHPVLRGRCSSASG